MSEFVERRKFKEEKCESFTFTTLPNPLSNTVTFLQFVFYHIALTFSSKSLLQVPPSCLLTSKCSRLSPFQGCKLDSAGLHVRSCYHRYSNYLFAWITDWVWGHLNSLKVVIWSIKLV